MDLIHERKRIKCPICVLHKIYIDIYLKTTSSASSLPPPPTTTIKTITNVINNQHSRTPEKNTRIEDEEKKYKILTKSIDTTYIINDIECFRKDRNFYLPLFLNLL